MAANALHEQGIVELSATIARGEASAVEVARHHLSRIDALDPGLNSHLHVDAEGALAQAASIDRARAAGDTLGPLAGVPISLKDNLCTRGMPTTCASKILEGYVPPYDAHVVEALRAAGAVVLGKLNMDEFAMGSSTENSAFGATRNPWASDRAPGGSSGGAAAATSAGLCAGSLGSDTGGSVRQPAGFCGVTALKPTYGRVSRRGLVAFASSLDQVGPITRSSRDAARLMGVIAGHDPRDATSAARPVDDYEAACGQGASGLRVGVVRAQLEGCDEDVAPAMDAALAVLQRLGCELVDVELPHARHGLSAYYIIAPAEASSNLARFDGMRFGLRVDRGDLAQTYSATRGQGFGAEVQRRIMLGTYVLSAGYYDAFYLKAQKVRTLIRNDFDAAFDRCDVMFSPVAPTPAFKLGENVDDPVSMYMQDVFTLPVSLAGIAAISTPCALSAGGLPIGMQLVAPAFEEPRLFRASAAFEREVALDLRPPVGEVP